MFTGIIEALGIVKKIEKEDTNIHFTIESPISQELKIDQSIAHNGVCLTVVALTGNTHTVTAIDETMQRSSLGHLQVNSVVNLERAMRANARLDGHFVQGHVDKTGVCTKIEDQNGSWLFYFEYEISPEHLLVDKGSICVNGTSLTVVNPVEKGNSISEFSVAIIPYTYENTYFKELKVGEKVNLEFDIIGKYIGKYMQLYKSKN